MHGNCDGLKIGKITLLWRNVKKLDEKWNWNRKYADKSEYRGNFANGKKHGIGYYKWIECSSYEGEWKNNKLDGYGIYV